MRGGGRKSMLRDNVMAGERDMYTEHTAGICVMCGVV